MSEQCGNCVRGLVNGVVCEECEGTALAPVVKTPAEEVDAIEKESVALDVEEEEVEKPKITKKK